MTKIYEALVNASEQVKSGQKGLTVRQSLGEQSGTEMVTDSEMVTLSHAIESALPGKERKIIQFLGSKPQEGVSTLSRSFAAFSAVSMNKRVLLVDGDRRNSAQNMYFGIRNTVGWQEALVSQTSLDDIVFEVGGARLFLWPSSNSSRVTAGIFNPQAMTALMDSLRSQFELVVIDSAPLSQSPDALAMAPYVDGVVLVVEAEGTRWRVAENTKDRLKACGANVLGVVFNKRRLHIPSFIYKRLR